MKSNLFFRFLPIQRARASKQTNPLVGVHVRIHASHDSEHEAMDLPRKSATRDALLGLLVGLLAQRISAALVNGLFSKRERIGHKKPYANGRHFVKESIYSTGVMFCWLVW